MPARFRTFLAAALAFGASAASPRVAGAVDACNAAYPASGCCAGDTLRTCDGAPITDSCATAGACAEQAHICGVSLGGPSGNQISVGCVCPSSSWLPSSFSPYCAGFCKASCTGATCPGECAGDQSCVAGTCQKKGCGHLFDWAKTGFGLPNDKLPGPQPALDDVRAIALTVGPASYSVWGYGVSKGGLVFPYGEFVGYGYGDLNHEAHAAVWGSITDAVEVAQSAIHTTVLRSNGTLVAWGGEYQDSFAQLCNPGYQVQPPVGLVGVTAIAASRIATAALKSDGTIAVWGVNTAAAPSNFCDFPVDYAPLTGSQGFRAVVGGGDTIIGIKTDGSLVQAARNGFSAPPAGLVGVTSVAVSRNVAAAVKANGAVVIWGWPDATLPPVPTDLLPVISVAVLENGYGPLHYTVIALQVDGTVRAWGDNADKFTAATAGLLVNANALEPHGFGALFCTGDCGAISDVGCCEGDVVRRCASGILDATPCATGTCGWEASGADFQCNTTGLASPSGSLPKACPCVPSCKTPDGTAMQCVPDGCGGVCAQTTCTDHNACTLGDYCAGETCYWQTPLACDDHNVCTREDCDATTGCTHTPVAGTCNDLDPCTIDDTCAAGVCKGLANPCDDGKACTIDTCTPEVGCAHTYASNDAPCDDGNACHVGESCWFGECLFTAYLVCDDNNPCTTDACSAQNGCTHTSNSEPCNDGNVCTLGDYCTGGTCYWKTALACDDGNPCTTEGCTALLGCSHTANTAACDDGNTCNGVDHCSDGACMPTAPWDCDDGNPCTDDPCLGGSGCSANHPKKPNGTICSDGSACSTSGICSAGVCTGIGVVSCDDGNPCTKDACDPGAGCAHPPVGGTTVSCSDGNACTAGDVCLGAVCTPGAVELSCDDGNPCTEDSCVASTGCAHVANARPCDDKDVCTSSSTCNGGLCVGSGSTSCGDDNPCTVDTCNPVLGCQHAYNTAPCDDANVCTKGDACWHGACQGTPGVGCDDKNPCTDDLCDAATGCSHKSNNKPCADADACTVGDACLNGGCLAGDKVSSCDDHNPCTTDSCNKATGCVHAPNALPCDDKSACTSSDVCQGGLCKGGKPVVCDDGNVCTDDGCAPSTGCTATHNTAACSDGNPCTTGESCAGGACKGGGPTDCDDKEPCTSDDCSKDSGGCVHFPSWYTACDDGNVCTRSDMCTKRDGKFGCVGTQEACYLASCSVESGLPKCGCTSGQVQRYSDLNAFWYCCTPNCTNQLCGDDGCGGSCGACAADEKCVDTFKERRCQPKVACYGAAPADGTCCLGRTLEACAAPNSLTTQNCEDGGLYCGWDANAKRYGCTLDGAAEPTGAHPFACPGAPACTPDCVGHDCGPDGCGGTCGTCGAGKSCTPSRQCVTPCEGIYPLTGCVTSTAAGDVISTCPSVVASAASVTQVTCSSAFKAGFSASKGKFVCGGKDSPPPGITADCPPRCGCGEGILKRVCGAGPCAESCGSCQSGSLCMPEGKCCTPSCTGKSCGDDGCGGSCGSCPEGKSCMWGGQCSVAACGPTTSVGHCVGSTAYYCTDNDQVKLDCAPLGLECNGGAKGASCLSAATVSCQGSCGSAAPKAGGCTCDAGCIAAGTCCPDFDVVCSASVVGAATCGNGKCDALGGETCLTCPTDCACAASSGGAAYDAPWQQVTADLGKPSAHARFVVHPLDDVRPAPPPLSLEGLVSYISDLSESAMQGSPRTVTALATLTDAGSGLESTDSAVQGRGLSNLTPGGASRFGVLRVRPDRPFRAHTSASAGSAGGFTAAGWVRVPAAASVRPNGLASAQALETTRPQGGGTFGSGVEVCRVGRPRDAHLTLACPAGNVITSVDAYYGEVAGDDATVAFGETCDAYRAVPRTYSCKAPAVPTDCIGKATCEIAPWLALLDPCSPAPHTPMRSRLMARALCSAGLRKAVLNLAVEDSASGGKLRLELAGQPSLRSSTSFPSDAWVHVAVAFEPYALEADAAVHDGRLTLYIDGREEAVAPHAWLDVLYEWDWGAARVEGAKADWPAWCGQDGAVNPSPQNVAALAEFDELALYERALTAPEIRGLRSKASLGVATVWPPVEARLVARDRLWTSGGKVTAVPVELPHLRDPSASTVSKAAPVHAEFMGLSVASGATLSMPAGKAGALGKLSQFTLGAWVRPNKVGAGTTLMEIESDGTTLLSVTTTAECGGRGLVATFATGASVSTSGCAHVTAAGEWTFVAVTQTASGRRLDLDGSVSTAAGSALLSPNGAGTSAQFVVTHDADLGWAALYDRALSRDEVAAARSTGPAVWLDGALVKPANAPSAVLRDWADYHNTTEAGPADKPRAHHSSGAELTTEATNFIASNAGDGFVEILTKGRLSTTGEPLSGHFTVVESVHIDVGALTVGRRARFRLFQLQSKGDVSTTATLHCYRQEPSATLPATIDQYAAQCAIFVNRANGNGYDSFASPPFLLGLAGSELLLRVAVSFGDHLRAAVGYRGEILDEIALVSSAEAKAGAQAKVGARTLSVALEPTSRPGPLWISSKRTQDGFAIPEQNPKSPGWEFDYTVVQGVYDARIYPRALGDGEIAAVVELGCEALGCGAQHRVCVQPSLPGSAHWLTGLDVLGCGACQAGFREANGQCVPLVGLMGECVRDGECGAGLSCVWGECLLPAQTDECVKECGLDGYECGKIHKGGGYGCQEWACRPHFKVSSKRGTRRINTYDVAACASVGGCSTPPWGWFATKDVVGCVWAPHLHSEDRCNDGLECDSGLCVERDTKVYSVSSSATSLVHGRHPWFWALPKYMKGYSAGSNGAAVGGTLIEYFGPHVACGDGQADTCAVAPKVPASSKITVCATTSASRCDGLNMQARLVRGTRWDGASVEGYVCEGCSAELYEGKPLYKESFSLMTPAGCETLYRNYFRLITPYAGNAILGTNFKGVAVGDQVYVSEWEFSESASTFHTLIPMPKPFAKGDLLEQEPSMAILRRLFLTDSDEDQKGPVTPALISKLQKAGVGDDLIAWETMPEWRKNVYRREFQQKGKGSTVYMSSDTFPIGACNLPKYTYTRQDSISTYQSSVDPVYDSPYFDGGFNRPICIPDKYPNGTTCPPPGKSALTDPTWARPFAGKMCDSGFCAADTHRCEDGDRRYETVFGNSRADGQDGGKDNDLGPLKLNQDDGGYYRFQMINSDPNHQVELLPGSTDRRDSTLHAKVKKGVGLFGADMITAIAASVTMHGAPSAKAPSERLSYKPTITVANIEPPSIFEVPKFACGKINLSDPASIDFTKSCKVKRTKVGVGVAPKLGGKKGKDGKSGGGGDGKAGSPTEGAAQTSAKSTAKGIAKDYGKQVGGMVAGNVLGSALSGAEEGEPDEDMIDVDGAVELHRFTLPLPLKECPKDLPGFVAVPGKLCYLQKTLVGPVPIKVMAELAPEVAMSMGAEMDPKTFEPALVFKPSVGLVLAVKGGVNLSLKLADIFAGVKAAITIIEIAFPVKFAIGFLAGTDAPPGTGGQVTDLWTVKKATGVDIEMTFLRIALGVFFEVSVSILKFTVDYEFFTFDGFRLRWALDEFNVVRHKLDFLWSPPVWTP